ncbi:MAG: glycosyltransferase [Flavobacteriales bacterium]
MEKKIKQRLLILSHKSPYAPVDGGVLAIRHFFEALVQDAHFEVFMICLSTQKHPHQNPPSAFEKHIKAIDIDTSLSKRNALIQLVKNKSYNLSRFYKHTISQDIQSHLDEQPDYDFILFESLFSTVYFDDLKAKFKGKFLYRSHNLEYRIWEGLAELESSFLKKSYLKYLAKSLKTYELKLCQNIDAIFTISSSDLSDYQNITKKKVYHLAYIRALEKEEKSIESTQFFHLGSMDWKPNIEAVDWLIERVWKPCFALNPDLRLHLAGKAMPERFFKLKSYGIEAQDYVAKGNEFMKTKGTLLVPLFAGSGVRIKLVDALCMHIPFISTTLGTQGLGLDDDLALIADNETDFQQHILAVADGSIKLKEQVEKGFQFAENQFSKQTVVQKFKTQLNQI